MSQEAARRDSRYDSMWNPTALEGYKQGRLPYRELDRKIVLKVLQEVFREGDKALEIGSGFGQLVGLVPEYAHRIVQSDQSVSIARRRETEGKYLVAHAYNLPFPQGSFDVVLGYASFDTILDLPQAVREMKRVLKSGGRIVHFLDLGACPEALLYHLRESGEESIPFPYTDELGRHIGVRLISLDTFNNMIRTIDPRKLLLMNFLREKDRHEEIFQLLDQRPAVLQDLADTGKKYAPESTVILYNDYFIQRFSSALQESGFSSISVKKETQNQEIPTPGSWRFAHYNFLTCDVGSQYVRFDPDIPSGKVRISRTILVISAEKP